MPKKLKKSLRAYLLKIKNSTNQIQLSSKTFSSPTRWISRNCKPPKTPSFAAANVEQDEANDTFNDAATLSDIDRFLFENFSSLFQEMNLNDGDHNTKESKNGEKNLLDLRKNFRGSRGVFIHRTSSGSVMNTSEDMPNSSITTDDSQSTNDRDDDDYVKEETVPDDYITLLKYSPDPYDDFKNSMEEMIETRLRFHGMVDWEFMEELLFCYLNLNDKKSCKFILSAFVDLVVALRDSSGRVPAKSRIGPMRVGLRRSGRYTLRISK